MKGYIFDMDGTLLDSLKAWHNTGNQYLESLGIQGDPQLDQKIGHMALNDGAQYLKDRFNLDKSIQEIIEGVKDIVAHKYIYEIPLKKGVKEFLKQCYDKGYQMCVLTASDATLAKKAFKRLEILDYFQGVYCCHEIGYNKNSVQSFIYAANQMKLKPEECIVVEDSLHAILTAKEDSFYVKAIYDQENQKDWDQIKQVADEYYQTFYDMKI